MMMNSVAARPRRLARAAMIVMLFFVASRVLVFVFLRFRLRCSLSRYAGRLGGLRAAIADCNSCWLHNNDAAAARLLFRKGAFVERSLRDSEKCVARQ